MALTPSDVASKRQEREFNRVCDIIDRKLVEHDFQAGSFEFVFNANTPVSLGTEVWQAYNESGWSTTYDKTAQTLCISEWKPLGTTVSSWTQMSPSAFQTKYTEAIDTSLSYQSVARKALSVTDTPCIFKEDGPHLYVEPNEIQVVEHEVDTASPLVLSGADFLATMVKNHMQAFEERHMFQLLETDTKLSGRIVYTFAPTLTSALADAIGTLEGNGLIPAKIMMHPMTLRQYFEPEVSKTETGDYCTVSSRDLLMTNLWGHYENCDIHLSTQCSHKDVYVLPVSVNTGMLYCPTEILPGGYEIGTVAFSNNIHARLEYRPAWCMSVQKAQAARVCIYR
ncbi:MAG: hypothetical protein JSS66_06815 [Armatimonadetes bacterium]|nr:hypothetical protein [Armatimonadota bacterium]